jgi:hypothetical protein
MAPGARSPWVPVALARLGPNIMSFLSRERTDDFIALGHGVKVGPSPENREWLQ